MINLLSHDNMTPCFPILVKLFYTNMSFYTPPESQAIISSVKNIPIKFTTHRLGTILTIPNVGISLKSVKLDNEGVLGNMLM